jgi:heat-inducible transcriptional repressor
MDDALREDRNRFVLNAVIAEYIKTGMPVGSRSISKKYGMSVSPATIRNVMADLEDLGYLYQPHTSAGRVPTDVGLRLYVDSILTIQQLTQAERERIRRAYRGGFRRVESLLKETSRILSAFSGQAGVVLTPRLSTIAVKHIDFVRLRPRIVLAILVSQAGILHNTIVQTEDDFCQDELDKYGRYLNGMLTDLTISQVKERLFAEMKEEKVHFDTLLAKILELSQNALQKEVVDSDLYIEGRTNLLAHPEFADVEQMRRIFAAFEEKSKIVELLDKSTAAGRVHIIIGSESELKGMEGISLIASPYTSGEEVLGTIGVIGPTRMNYSRIIPLVDYTSKLLSKMLEESL